MSPLPPKFEKMNTPFPHVFFTASKIVLGGVAVRAPVVAPHVGGDLSADRAAVGGEEPQLQVVAEVEELLSTQRHVVRQRAAGEQDADRVIRRFGDAPEVNVRHPEVDLRVDDAVDDFEVGEAVPHGKVVGVA